jgi:hypothetical protein
LFEGKFYGQNCPSLLEYTAYDAKDGICDPGSCLDELIKKQKDAKRDDHFLIQLLRSLNFPGGINQEKEKL